VPDVDVTEAGGRHRLWRVDDPAACTRFADALAPETIVIADGHHRYETALAYRDARGGASPTVLAFLCSLADPGLVILPTHRLVRAPLALAADALLARLRERFDVWSPDAAPRAAGEIDVAL